MNFEFWAFTINEMCVGTPKQNRSGDGFNTVVLTKDFV